MRRYSPLSSGLREPSFCGKPECAEERPEYAEWTIELDPSSPSATLVPRSRVNHDQRPILAPTARSPSYSEVRRPPSAAREDALSTVLRLLGVPEEKKESQTVCNCLSGLCCNGGADLCVPFRFLNPFSAMNPLMLREGETSIRNSRQPQPMVLLT